MRYQILTAVAAASLLSACAGTMDNMSNKMMGTNLFGPPEPIDNALLNGIPKERMIYIDQARNDLTKSKEHLASMDAKYQEIQRQEAFAKQKELESERFSDWNEAKLSCTQAEHDMARKQLRLADVRVERARPCTMVS